MTLFATARPWAEWSPAKQSGQPHAGDRAAGLGRERVAWPGAVAGARFEQGGARPASALVACELSHTVRIRSWESTLKRDTSRKRKLISS